MAEFSFSKLYGELRFCVQRETFNGAFPALCGGESRIIWRFGFRKLPTAAYIVLIPG
jgi:hypothetical protein